MIRRGAALFLEEFAPNVNPVKTQDWPFENVGPRELITAQRPTKFEDKGTDTDHFSNDETQVNSKNFLTLSVH